MKKPPQSTEKRKEQTRSDDSESLRLLRTLTDAMRVEEDAVEQETGVRPSHSDVVGAWRAGSSQKEVRQHLIDLCLSMGGNAPPIPGSRSAKEIKRALAKRD